MKKILFTLLTPFLLQTTSFAQLSNSQGSWANEIKAYGSNDTSNNYDASFINNYSRSTEKRNQMSITKTYEALVNLGQNLYGFYLDTEATDWTPEHKKGDDDGDGILEGSYGTPYDCGDERDTVGQRFCELIDFLAYTKDSSIKVILINSKYQTGKQDRWFNEENYEELDMRDWASSLVDMANDVVELNSHYPNLVGFSVDDFGAKICTFERVNNLDTEGDNCITKSEIEDIYNAVGYNEDGEGVQFYPLIYTQRSNHLIHDSIFLGKSRDSIMDAGEKIKVVVPLDVKVFKKRGRLWVQDNSVRQICKPTINGITSDSKVTLSEDDPDYDAYEGITKKMSFEFADGRSQTFYERSFLDPESYNDLLSTYINEFLRLTLSNNENVNLVFELSTETNLRLAINAIWTISNIEISCPALIYSDSYRISVTPRIADSIGYVKPVDSSRWLNIGSSSLDSQQKKFFAGNTINYRTGNYGFMNTDKYDYASIINSYQLVWEWYGFEKSYTETWSDEIEYRKYFDEVFKKYHNKSTDFILTMYGINEQLMKGDYLLKELNAEVVKSYGGNFWYYKGGLELYYLNDSNNIGYMSHTEKDTALSEYNNTIWIPQFSTKYPDYYACYFYQLAGGYEHRIELKRNGSNYNNYKVNIILDGGDPTQPNWESDNTSTFTIDLTANSTPSDVEI